MKTTIVQTENNEVTLSAIDPYTEEVMTRVYWIPNSGGYVRQGDHDAGDPQVCAGLSLRGSTLSAENGEDLLRLIRSEWRTYRRKAIEGASK